MNDNIKDPREIGVKGLRGIRMGEVDSPSLSPEYTGLAPMKKMSGREYLQRQIEADIDRGPIEYVGTDEYGNSRYDDEITQLSEIKDINEARANIQPWYDQIGAGVLKGTVLAATTFADGIGGTIVGAMNVLGNIDKIQNSDSPLRELGNQFINNPFSTTMQEINEKMESTLPNYYTQEEMNAPWWENVFTSNFIGDKFLKNLGFTVGAAYSGRLSAGLLSKTMSLKGVRDAFKGTVTTASGKVLNTADEISKAYKTGDAFMDGVKLTEDLGNAAKKLKNAEWKLKTMGAISGAMGEGRIEAISNSKEFYDYHAKLIEDDRKKKTDFLEYQLYQEHPEWFDYVETDGRFSRVLTSPEGIAEWENRKEAIDTKYQNALGKLAKDRASMANAVFIANVGLLSASNMWQYGRFLTGGYNSGRLANGLVKGSAKEGFKYNSEYAKRQLAKAASNPLVEAQEEMSQAMIAETTGQKYASELNEFYGARISPDAEKQTVDWLKAIETGFMNTYGDIDKWEEGFLGGLTGLLGIPSISMKKTDKGRRPSLTLEGELWEGLRDYKKDKTEATELVSALNNRLQSPEFLNYYQGMIRHNKYQNDMESALNKGDKFSYKNAELSQFVSDAIMFEKAGRLQDLYDIIDEASNISDDDIEDIKSMTIDKASGKSIFDSRTNDEIKEHITRQAKEAKEKLDSYSKISNDLKTLYGEDIQSDFLEELTWKMASIDDLEIRTQHVIDDIKKPLQYKAKEIKDTFGIDINVTLDTFSDFKNSFSEDSNIISEIVDVINNQDLYVEEGRERIEGIIRRYNKNIRDNNLSLGRNIRRIRLRSKSGEYSPDVIGSEEEARAAAKENYNSLFSKIIELKDFLNHKNNKILSPLDVEKITNSLEDLIKLYSVRSEFIDSYMQLSKNPQLFTEGVQESIRKAMDNYENSQVDELLNKLKSANNIKDIENVSSSYDDNIVKKAISRAKSSNDSNLKDIMKTYDDYNKLSKSLSNILNNIPDSPEKISIVNVISDAVDNSSSAEEVISTLQKSVSELPKTVGDSIEKILKKVTKHKSSRESTEEDKNTPKRSMKKKKDTKKGFLSNFGDTVKPDAEILERTQESESRITDEIKKEKDEDDTIEDAEVIEEDENVDVEIPTSDNAVEELERMSDRQLKKISNGEATIEDDDNKGSIKKLAKSILTSREALEEVNNAEGSNSEDNISSSSANDSPHLRSWVYSKYDFNALKDRSIRRAKINNNPIVEALDELDAFDFVDDGRLGVLFNENNNIPIHYVKVQDSRLEDVIVLAIEVTKNTSKLVDTSKSFVAQDGKRYQAVGALGYDSNNKESKRSYNTINWALEEEYSNYIDNINKESKEPSKYFTSSRLHNKIKHIYSGRMVKTTNEEAPRQRPLKDIVGDTPNLAVYYRGKMTAPTLDSEYDDIAPLNSNNANYRDGSVWFMSKEADGKYYSKAVKVKRFTESEYDIESHKDTPVVESIIEDIQTLVKPVSEFKSRKAAEYQKSIAKYNLMSSLYFPEDTVPVFFINKKGETIISITNYEDNIGDGLEGDDKVNEILNYLQSDDLNLRFQIIPNKLGESTYLKDLMNSDILTTDIALANNVNSSFDLYTVDNSGEIIEEVNSSRRKGHTGRKGVNGALVSKSLTLNSKSYSVTDSEVRLNGELITDENTIDEIRLLEKISSKSINPIEGNPKLFLGTYNNGEKFGIINGKVKTGKTLEGLLEAANKRKNNSIKENKSAAEKLKNLLKTKDNMETKQEKSENTSIFEDASDFNFDEVDDKIEDTSDSEEGTSLFSDDTDFVFPDMKDTIKEEKEEIKATPKKKKSKVTPSPVIMTDTFVPIAGRSAKELEEKIEDFESIANDYLDDIESLGYDNIDDFISYAESEGVDTSSVTTKEAFEAALETLKHCR